MKHFGLIGHPLGHSLSPQIHSVIMQEIGLDGEYTLYDIAPEDMPKEIPELLKKLDGFNCTIPHKNAIVPFLDCVSDSAKFCTCVNTVYKGVGYNTDILGFGSYGIAFAGKRVLVLGSGGTCRMMFAAALAGGAIEVVVAARNGATALVEYLISPEGKLYFDVQNIKPSLFIKTVNQECGTDIKLKSYQTARNRKM
jgi:shikimate dehydrogenase